MALYESVFIANQELTSKQVDSLTQNCVDFLKNSGGKLVKKEYWGVRNFAYEIKKQRKGHYVMLCIECPADSITKFDAKLKKQEEILKYVNFRVKEFLKHDSSLVKNNEDK